MSISSIPSWGVAIAQWLLIPAATGLTAGFAAASSKARPAVAVAVIALGYSFQFGFSSSIPDLRISGPLAGVCWANIFNALDILLWSRISYRSQVEWERSRNSAHERQLSSFSKQLKWSLALPFNYRRIDTPWEIRNLPKFDKRDSQSVPSRSAFLLQAAMKLFISVFLLIVSIVEPDVPGVGALVSEMCGRSPSLIPRSADISLRNLLAQASFVLSFAMMTRFSINAIYYTFAVICVSSCFSEPASWPPISELITEAWSIQRFWRYAWHQCYRVALCSNAKFVTSFFCPSGTLLSQYIRTAFAFLISGFFHMMMDHGFGIPLEKSGAMCFFGFQAVGMLIEDSIQRVIPTRLSGDTVWKRWIGYAWILVFFIWSNWFWVNPLVWQLYQAGVALPTPFLIPGSYRILALGGSSRQR